MEEEDEDDEEDDAEEGVERGLSSASNLSASCTDTSPVSPTFCDNTVHGGRQEEAIPERRPRTASATFSARSKKSSSSADDADDIKRKSGNAQKRNFVTTVSHFRYPPTQVCLQEISKRDRKPPRCFFFELA